ncbi:MAG TPA: ABC transporter permease [Bryobacteraceae bacterium]|nr:ABC transporter permease [Bryobacteraceae bacterium]
MAALVLLAGWGSAMLLRDAPGALVDERELNPRAGEETIAALRHNRARERSVAANLASYLRGLAHGELGFSESNHTSVAALIADRAPRTLRDVGCGLTLGWIAGLAAAVLVARFPRAWPCDVAFLGASAIALSLPAAFLAYLAMLAQATPKLVLAVVIAPEIFQYSRNVLRDGYGAAHVEMARARGVSESAILARHVFPAAAPPLIALAAASVSMAIGAAIPIEAICDAPGLGRLAWQAATARDLPLLINMTMLVALATTSAMTISEFFVRRGNR